VNIVKELIDRCLSHEPSAQEELYMRYAPKMYGICLRFSGDAIEAKDLLQEGFIRVFQQLASFRSDGSFEGWLRRIFINTAININKRELRFSLKEKYNPEHHWREEQMDIFSQLSQKEFLDLIQQLPKGYRTVFNLFVIEGYTHREIGKMLKISENTSKSQLSGAKRSLRKRLTEQGYVHGNK